MSYSSLSGLVYIPATDRQSPMQADPDGGNEWMNGSQGRLIAWDPASQSTRWSVEEPIATNGGVLSTAGNLVFQGQGTGEFAAYTADTGTKVWSIKTGSAIDSVPVTYSVNGEQYVLTPVGWGSGSRLFAPAWTMATPESKRGPARLLAFKLGATTPFPTPPDIVPPVPKPPPQTASSETIQEGKHIYRKFVCDGCHSPRSTAAAPGYSTAPSPISATPRPKCTSNGTPSSSPAPTGTKECPASPILQNSPSPTRK